MLSEMIELTLRPNLWYMYIFDEQLLRGLEDYRHFDVSTSGGLNIS